MSAREMFEELGFELSDDKSLGTLKYIKIINSTRPTEYWHINFHKGECVYESFKTIDGDSERDYGFCIFFEWHKAIQKQIEELGWE